MRYAMHLPARMDGDDALILTLWEQQVRGDGHEPDGRPTWRVVEEHPSAVDLYAEFGGPSSMLLVEGDVR